MHPIFSNRKLPARNLADRPKATPSDSFTPNSLEAPSLWGISSQNKSLDKNSQHFGG
jgi:hypothetical protein